MYTIEIGGSKYDFVIDFNAVCDLAARGLDIFNRNTPMTLAIRTILAWVMDTDDKTAGKAINDHLREGGSLDDILVPFTEAVAHAGFIPAQTDGSQETPQGEESGKRMPTLRAKR